MPRPIGGIEKRARRLSKLVTPRRQIVSSSRKFSVRDPVTTIFWIGDTHDHGLYVGEPTGDPNLRQNDAINALPGTLHPSGDPVPVPNLVVQVGDFVHEDTGTVDRIAGYYTVDGSGAIKFPCAVLDGNHDRADVRALITARHGSLNWGMKVGNVWIQALTENYTAPFNTTPPTAAQINAVKASLAGRSPNEPIIFTFHRALSGGYPVEWAADALDALEALCKSRNTICIVHGHDHYSQHFTWRGIRVFSPGSVTQSPIGVAPPYGVIYPESFVVMRIGAGWFDVASYVFGYDVFRVWNPGWEWEEGPLATTQHQL